MLASTIKRRLQLTPPAADPSKSSSMTTHGELLACGSEYSAALPLIELSRVAPNSQRRGDS
jgi:hypothetical protein